MSFLRPRIEEPPIEGFLVGVGRRWALLHLMQGELYLNGYSAVRLEEIEEACVLEKNDRFAARALELRGFRPVAQPVLKLDDAASLLTSANAVFPLLTVHTEGVRPDACFIGRIARLTAKKIWLEEIDPAARWRPRPRSYRLGEITRVDLGGLYEEALIEVAEARGDWPRPGIDRSTFAPATVVPRLPGPASPAPPP